MIFTILDVTRAFPQAEARLIEMAETTLPQDSHQWSVLCHSRQASSLRPDLLPLCKTVNDQADPVEIASEVWTKLKSAREQNGGQAVVVTFHPQVLSLQQHVNPAEGVFFKRWGDLRPPFSDSDAPAATSSLDLFNDYLTEEEIAAALKEALGLAKAFERSCAITQTTIRGYLEKANGKFVKNSHPRAKQQGLISAVLAFGRQQGIIKIEEGPDSARNKIWLAPEYAATFHGVRVPSGNRQNDSSIHAPHGDGQLANNLNITTQSRSDLFVDTLRSRNFGPFSRVRRVLFTKLDEIVAEGKMLSPIALVRDAIERARIAVEHGNGINEADRNKHFPWRGVREFFTRLLQVEPIFYNTEGEKCPPTWAYINQRVARVREHWKLDLDGYLVLELIRAGIQIGTHDIPHLAGALFNGQTIEDETRAEKVIAHLIDLHKVEVDEDGWLTIPSVTA